MKKALIDLVDNIVTPPPVPDPITYKDLIDQDDLNSGVNALNQAIEENEI